jgi:hypothetical protein
MPIKMKKTLFFIVSIILGTIATFAQNYQTIYPDRTALYVSSGSIFPLYAKEEKSGDLLIYSLNKVIEYESYYGGSNNAPTWAGEKVIIRSDGTNVYFNKNNNQIIIKPQARLNEKWWAYQPADSSIIIEAEVVKIEQTTTLGQPDTVKTISFIVRKNNGNVEFAYGKNSISISKNYGWVNAPNFYYFPETFYDMFNSFPHEIYSLVGISNPQLGVQNLTTFSVYDFQPDDIIQTHETERYSTDKIPLKQTDITTSNLYLERTDYTDSIFYTVLQKKEFYRIYNDSTAVYTSADTITQIIKPISDLDKLPYETGVIADSSNVCMTEMSVNNPIIKYLKENYRLMADRFTIPADQSVLGYYKGLGGPYFDCEGCGYEHRILTYYKKGTETWGTPYNFTGIETISDADNIQLYPNPATDNICIEVLELKKPMLFELFTIDGKTIFQQPIISSEQVINIAGYRKGNYLYRFTEGNKAKKIGKLAIQ